MPPPPGFEKPDDHRLSEDEAHHILKNELRRSHFEDKGIMRFIDSYMRCRSVAQAERDAFLNKGQGHNILRKPDVYTAIQKIDAKAMMKYGYSAEEVVERVKEIVNVDPAEIEKPDGSGFKTRLSDIAPETRRAIRKFKAKNTYFIDPNGQYITDDRGQRIVETEIIEVEFWDKTKNTELLGREKDLFKETRKIEHDVGSNMRNFLLDSQNRGEQRALKFRDITPVAQLTAPATDEESSS